MFAYLAFFFSWSLPKLYSYFSRDKSQNFRDTSRDAVDLKKI